MQNALLAPPPYATCVNRLGRHALGEGRPLRYSPRGCRGGWRRCEPLAI